MVKGDGTMRFETKEYHVWYTDGLGTSGMYVRATSTHEAIRKAESLLPEHGEIISIKEV